MNKRKHIILVFIFLFFRQFFCFSQDTKKSKQYMRNADIEMYDNNFQKALELYRKAYEADTANPKIAFKRGVCMYSMKKYRQQSVIYFEKAKQGGITEAGYYLGYLYHLNGKFEEAIRMFQDYKNSSGKKNFTAAEIDRLIGNSRMAFALVKEPVHVTIENIGGVINSEFPDYVPVISADESMLIFTSRRPGSAGGLFDPFGEYFEDVYISEKKDGQWAAPRSISVHINTHTHDACVGLSADGEILFLYRTSADVISGDLYVSVFDGKDWIVPEKLPAPINVDNFTEPSASLLPDGQVLYFSSNRPGGYGKKDIYRVVKLGNGQWSKAVNLGPAVNTPEDDDSPFIHPDGKTLYFSSKGHKNMGGYDIFKTTLSKGDLLGKDVWSEPENLGYPVNTPDDDIYFVLSTDGKRGYYSSEKSGGHGAADIYLIHFPEENFGLGVFKGKVVSADSANASLDEKTTFTVVSADSSNIPLNATITLFDVLTNNAEGIYKTNPLTGRFIIIFSQGKEYMMKVESDGYDPYTEKIKPSSSEEAINQIKLRKAER